MQTDTVKRHRRDEQFVTITGLKAFEDEDEQFVTITGLKAFEDEDDAPGRQFNA